MAVWHAFSASCEVLRRRSSATFTLCPRVAMPNANRMNTLPAF